MTALLIRDHKVWKPFNHYYPVSYFPIYPIFHPFFTISESPIPIYSSLLAICSIWLGQKRTKTLKKCPIGQSDRNRKVGYFPYLLKFSDIWNILNRNNRHVRLIKMFILFHFMFYLLWFPSKFITPPPNLFFENQTISKIFKIVFLKWTKKWKFSLAFFKKVEYCLGWVM